MMPSLFIAHGAPTLAIESNAYTAFLQELAGKIQKPKAIVLFSAHWESGVQAVGGAEQYETIYDFGGFPDEMYQIKYPARGDMEIAREVASLFAAKGIPSRIDENRGLDHGSWVVLRLLYPQAEIPVIALSVNRQLTNEQQYRIGSALASLREQDILIVGSGGTVHNLRRVSWGAEKADDWALRFDDWLKEKLEAWDTEALFQYETQAPFAQEAVPPYGNEHFVPLLLAMGAADATRKASLLYRSFQYGSLSLSCWQFD
ncbi:dioxygenase [Paenibacillus sp. MBLB4367]|uniref:dioxygenase family protein n=1 Tax=Paenibacillus sp. MBLB4367 TaxID=3384767 RepID=UPI0039081FDD